MANAKSNRSRSATQLLDDMTKCCICLQIFTSPRILPCVHTFCLKCLESYAADKKQGEKISCPICRREWKIPVDGVQGFQRNTFAEKLVEIVRNLSLSRNSQVNSSLKLKSKEARCDVCLESRVNPNEVLPIAQKHCIECQQNMCRGCAYHHKSHKITSEHEVINLDGSRDSMLVTIKSEACEKHPNKPLAVYCIDCSVPMCHTCFHGSHSGHKFEDVKQRADTVKKQLEGAVAEIKRLTDELNNILSEELPKSLLDFIAQTEVEIHKRSIEVKTTVDLHEKRLLEYLNTVKKRRQKELSTEKTDAETYLCEMDSFLTMARTLQEQGSTSDMSSTGTMFMLRAQELQEKYDKMYRKLKSKVTLPVTELVPLDIENLLSYSAGNLIGKIKVNILEKGLGNEDGYYMFRTRFDDDDKPFADCVYIPEPETTPPISYGSTCNDYEVLPTGRLDLSVHEPQPPPPLPPRQYRSGTSAGPLKTSGGNTTLTEIRPSSLILHEKLCRGKYTEIWRGELKRTGDVSVKKFTEEALREQWMVNDCDFFREAGILQEFRHPHIVNLIGVSTRSSPFYVITEFASNGFLDKFLQVEKQRRNAIRLDIKDVIHMAAQIAGAMYYLETRDCIHRSLAARSILVGANYSLKVANFEMAVFLKPGVQEWIQSNADIDELHESPIRTRAPEVIKSQRWSIKSDVWSYAIVIYEILTYGAKPYPGVSESDLLNRILISHDILCPAGLNFRCTDPKLRSIMESCWKKDPNERPDFNCLLENVLDLFKQKDLMGYMRSPSLTKVLKLRGSVSGITVYNAELFITRHESTTIDAFNTTTFKRTNSISTAENKSKFPSLFKKRHSQSYCGLQDITSCKLKGFIYVSSGQDYIIHRIDSVSRSVCGSWEVKSGDPTTLAVTKYGNLLVSCAIDGKVLEYTSDGKLLHRINFACDGLGPLHTIQLTNERFAVCHGGRQVLGENQGLTIVDTYGNSIPNVKPLDSKQPCHLAIDSNNNVLIADRGCSKLILWNPIKGWQRVLISIDQKMNVSTRIHLDESTGQLLMLSGNDTLMIYKVKSTESKTTTNDYADYYS